jgi:hypothetical protein
MILKKTSLAVLALSAALVFSLPPVLQAATRLGPGAKVQTGNMIQPVQAKKEAKKAVKKAAVRKGPGMCGTNMYWDKKTKKCADARAKK